MSQFSAVNLSNFNIFYNEYSTESKSQWLGNTHYAISLEICLLPGSNVPSTLNLINYCKQTA